MDSRLSPTHVVSVRIEPLRVSTTDVPPPASAIAAPTSSWKSPHALLAVSRAPVSPVFSSFATPPTSPSSAERRTACASNWRPYLVSVVICWITESSKVNPCLRSSPSPRIGSSSALATADVAELSPPKTEDRSVARRIVRVKVSPVMLL